MAAADDHRLAPSLATGAFTGVCHVILLVRVGEIAEVVDYKARGALAEFALLGVESVGQRTTRAMAMTAVDR